MGAAAPSLFISREQTVGLVARLAGAQPAHLSSSPRLDSGAQEFSSIKKCQQVLVPGLVSFYREQTVGLVARLAGAQPAHLSSSPRLRSGAQEFSSIKKCQRVLVPGLVSFF
jgi:hypothetical protein